MTDNPEIDIRDQLAAIEAEYHGEFSVEVLRLDEPGHFAWRADRVLPTASVFKLCVLCELFRQSEAGHIDLSAPVTWKPELHRGGDGVLRAMVPGQELSVHNMAILMMIVSDNVATATLVDLVGPRNVTATMQAWGLRDTNIFEGLPGGPRARDMQQPVSTAHDLCALITMIHREEVLTPATCREIVRILRAQRCNDMLPRFIPVGEDWGEAENWIANKTGYGQCRVEVGVVKVDELLFSLAMFFRPNGLVSWNRKCLADYPPVLAMAEGCRAVYEALVGR